MKCKVIKRSGQAILVEWMDADGFLHRASVPESEVMRPDANTTEAHVEEDVLEMGIPWGVPWEHIIVLNVTPEDVAQSLRKAGIWTHSDVMYKPQAVIGAIQAAYSIDLATLLRKAGEFKEVV